MRPFPQLVKTNLKYHEVLSKTLATEEMHVVTYALNDVFDPNVALGGHQPLGYDDWASKYRKWCVTGCKFAYKWTLDTISGQNGLIWIGHVITGDPDPPNYDSRDTFLEDTRVNTRKQINNGEWPAKNLWTTVRFSPRKWFKIRNLMADDTVVGYENGGPARKAYIHLFMWRTKATDLTILTEVDINYRTNFYLYERDINQD